MNFSGIAEDLGEQALATLKYILSLNISDAAKREILTRFFKGTGYPFYNKIFNDSSELFGSEAIGTEGYDNPDDQIERLSAKVVQNYNLGRESTPAITRGFYDSLLGGAENEAFGNAKSLDRHPTLTRRLRGETCGWCAARTGTFVDPDGELFARHDNCDCLFITSGFNSRNGVLTNYSKNTSFENKVRIGSLDDVFENKKPGVGSVQREGGLQIPKRKTHEAETFRWLKKEVGGNFTILDESRKKGVNMPDGIRNNTEIIEVKKISTTNSISDGVRYAIRQTSNESLAKTTIQNYEKMNKIAILDGRGATSIESISPDEAWNIIERRIIRSVNDDKSMSLDYVIIRRNNGTLVYRI